LKKIETDSAGLRRLAPTSPIDQLEYLADLLAEMRGLADQAGSSKLAVLLEIAEREAQLECQAALEARFTRRRAL
jgi:hypothetical protein